MSEEEFKNILKNVPSGTPFSARVDTHTDGSHGFFATGKIHVVKDEFWCCYNDGPYGDVSPDLHGYTHSWAITSDNRKYTIEDFVIIPKEEIINTYDIY